MTNNEKMIELFGVAKDGEYCVSCAHLISGSKCDIAKATVNRHMPACGKFEEEKENER